MGLSIPQLLVIAVIVVLLFGSRKLKNLGPDLGSAIKGFRSALNEADDSEKASPDAEARVIDGEVSDTDKSS
jgi:sec-independent protein translocase protein TatA